MRNLQQDKDRNNQALWWGIGIGAVVLVIITVVVLSTTVLSKLTADELAKRWVESNVDAAGEEIAAFLSGNNWAVRELGGEWIEGKINEVVLWSYGPEEKIDDRMSRVVATASVSFDVNLPVASGRITASMPFVLEIDLDAQRVAAWHPDVMGAALSTTIPAVGETIEQAQEVVEEAKETAEEAKEAVESKVEAVKDVASGLSSIGEGGDCLESARDAGVPDNAIGLLEKPASERGMMERTLVKTALDAAGLTENCAELLE